MGSASLRASLCYGYAQFLTWFGLKARAIEFLQVAVQEDPQHQRAWSAYAFLSADRGRFDAAVRAFEKALALKPDDAPACFNLAYVLQKSRKHEEALPWFQRAIDIDPFLDRAWYGMGLSLMQLGRLPEAVEKLREAARLQYFNPYAGYQLASALHKLGEHEQVKAEYDRIKGFDPKIAAQMRANFGVKDD
jgi:tetratricopeptide (TPR) repeat protein